jgi:carbon monoxide dehydrogenase subunit G
VIETRASVRVAAPRATVFDIAVDPKVMARIFRGCGPIPAIERVEVEGGGPSRTGGVRWVHNSDGSVVREELVEIDRPATQSYRLVSGFRPPFSWLVRGAAGHWRFEEEPDGTRVTWRFTFEPRSRWVAPLVGLVARRFFRRAQERCLDALRAECETS